MHDYPDERAVEILKQIVPVLGSKSRIVVMDGVLPEPNTLPKSEERIIRMMDMQMSTMLNSREREWADWKALFARADPRLNLCKVLKPDRSINSVMEVVLKQA
jgi:6-hydroxytryprostatin B O-methyltransferase